MPEKILTFLLCLLVFPSCIKEKKVTLLPASSANEYLLAVEGGLVAGESIQSVSLSRPVLHQDSSAFPLTGAVVSIFDGVHENRLMEGPAPGRYSGPVADSRRYNQAYLLEIDYQGEHFQASDVLSAAGSWDAGTLPLKINLTGKGLEIHVPRHSFGYASTARWVITYGDLPAYKPGSAAWYPYLSYSHAEGSPNPLYPLVSEERVASLRPADSVRITRLSSSAQYGRYLYTVFQETDWKNIFSGTPSQVEGNVYGNALGYFYATQAETHIYTAAQLLALKKGL